MSRRVSGPANSILFGWRDAFAGAPILHQPLAARWIARFERLARRDPVGAKMAKALPEFAPGHYDPRLVEIADAERPDRARSLGALGVVVLERELMFGSDGGADWA